MSKSSGPCDVERRKKLFSLDAVLRGPFDLLGEVPVSDRIIGVDTEGEVVVSAGTNLFRLIGCWEAMLCAIPPPGNS